MKKGKVVTVIPNWNLKEDLIDCITSLQSSDWLDHEIVVVDNASTDGSADFIREHYPSIVLFALKENTGYAGALNKGIRYALSSGAEYVFCINNDTIIPSQTIGQLVRRMNQNKTIGILNPKILVHDHPNILYSLGSKTYWFCPVPIEFGHRRRNNQQYQGLQEYDYVTGCAIMVRIDIFKDIGLFDESYFMYYEDDDFCRRARDKAFKVACDMDAVIYHKVSLSSKKQASKITFIRTRNRIWFYRRYRHGPSRLLTWFVLWVMAFGYSLSHLLRGQVDWFIPYWSGFFEGWRKPLPIQTGIFL